MEEKDKIDSLVSHAKQYAETRYDLLLIDIQDKVSDGVASIASILLLAVLSIFFLLFLSIGAAWLVGQATNNPAMGFFSVAGFYLIIALIIYFGRDKLIRIPIINMILKKISIHEED
jgi:hypothetical protein